ncbi:hypothetical protein C7C46_06165 [Streptomyces tateyamensis]|uniref:Uncharacterized protein n=1 Tax=Streptomyces tateyamensis TaxID=565073 RepID=A0A2V4NZ98_9ACTN|nr:hypothetical protein C7C46_06165 [Streptomyces tateyamensis]
MLSCSTAPPAPHRAAEAVAELLARYGDGPVSGVTGSAGPLRAADFQLPVAAQPSDARLRPPFAAPLAELAGGRHTLTPEELPTGHGVEVRLALPAAFHALTVRGSGRALAEQLAEVAEELFAAEGLPARRDWAVLTATLADPGAAAGVRYAGLAAVELDGRPSSASLVVAVHRDATPVAELAAELATSRPHAEVWTVILPAGPAVVLVQSRTGAVPAALTGDGVRHWLVCSVMQAFLPLPDGGSLLSVQLGTAQGEDWERYAQLFADLLRSVETGWDGEPAQLTERQLTAAQLPPVPQLVPVQPAAAPPVPPRPPAPPVVPAPSAAPAVTPAPDPDPAPEGVEETPVLVPPDDLDPFAKLPEPPGQPVRAAAPEPPAPEAVPAPVPKPVPLDPFGTVMANQPQDPFGTVTRQTPAGAAAPPRPASAPAAAAPPGPGKGTPVLVPPDDFDPFAPQPEEPAQAPAAKGTPVLIPPDDFDPFAPQPEEPAQAPAAKGTPVLIPPDDFDPFAPQPEQPARSADSPASSAASAPPKPDPFS